MKTILVLSMHPGFAESIRAGQLGILDYYKLRNVQADTEMRTAIAGGGSQARNGQKVQP